jgi:hypothetical protein
MVSLKLLGLYDYISVSQPNDRNLRIAMADLVLDTQIIFHPCVAGSIFF